MPRPKSEWWELELRYVKSTGEEESSVVIHNREIFPDSLMEQSVLGPEVHFHRSVSRLYGEIRAQKRSLGHG